MAQGLWALCQSSWAPCLGVKPSRAPKAMSWVPTLHQGPCFVSNDMINLCYTAWLVVLVPKPGNLLPVPWPVWAVPVNSVCLQNDVLCGEGSEHLWLRWAVMCRSLQQPSSAHPQWHTRGGSHPACWPCLIPNPLIFWANTEDKEVYKMNIKTRVAVLEKDQFLIFWRDSGWIYEAFVLCAFPTPQGLKPELEPCKGWILLPTITA